MTMTKIRILGSVVGVQDYFVDARIEKVSLDGEVTLVEDVETDPRQLTLGQSEINQWREENNAILHENITDPQHPLWDILDQLYQSRDDESVQDLAATLETNAERLFRSLIAENADE
jgi:hypothetical protein